MSKNTNTEIEIRNFETRFKQLDAKIYNSIQSEIKRTLILSKKIKINAEKNYYEKFIKILNINNGRYFKIDHKLTQVISLVPDQKIVYRQLYKEFYIDNSIIFKRKKIIFKVMFKHKMPLKLDSINGFFLRRHLKRDFQKRVSLIKNIWIEVK